MGNPNFDAIVSSTMKKYAPTFTDNVFSNLPLLYWLRRQDRLEKVDGGEQLVEPLMHALNSTAGSYAGYDSLNITPQGGISAAVYDWRQFNVTVAISGIEEAKNSGESAVFSLLKAKIRQAELSAQEDLDRMFFLDGAGNGGKDWFGLAHFISPTPTSGVVGGIDRSVATNSWWRNYVEATTAALTIAHISTGYNTVSRGNDRPDLILTTQALYERYEALLQPQLRLSDPKTADAGFHNLLYKWAPVMYDDYCQSGRWYYLNSKYLSLKAHTKVWMKPTEFIRPPGQDAKYSQFLSYGNLVASNCRRLGVLTNKTA